jgi:hypothetical protein
VTTPSDFGTRSDPPSHPELLDWLASRFVQEGWSTKWLVRQIVLVERVPPVERSSGRTLPRGDPENRLLWRANRRRLDLESLRDSLLVAAGRLNTTMGGPSVELTQRAVPGVARCTVSSSVRICPPFSARSTSLVRIRIRPSGLTPPCRSRLCS